MSGTPIMTIHVMIDRSNCPEMNMPDGKVKIIPFTGTADGKLFQGTVMPGAADVQVTNPAGVRHMCAQYMLEGKDETGTMCHIFVENHGYSAGSISGTRYWGYLCLAMNTRQNV